MRLFLCVVACFSSVFCLADEKISRFPAPDGNAEAFVLPVPFKSESPDWTESIIYFRDYAEKQMSYRDFTSGDSEHGLFFVKGTWTPDSEYFIFSTNSSGGHSPWHFRTFVFNRSANSVVDLTDFIPPVVSPNMIIKAPNTIHLRVMDSTLAEPIDGKDIDISLAGLLKTK